MLDLPRQHEFWQPGYQLCDLFAPIVLSKDFRRRKLYFINKGVI